MVVPHTNGQLVRSMVRIPGSGSDREADPVLLDLSNVSPLAACIPVPQTLPRGLFKSNNPRPTSSSDQRNESTSTAAKKLMNASAHSVLGTNSSTTKSEPPRQLKRKNPSDSEEDTDSPLPPPEKSPRQNIYVTPQPQIQLQGPSVLSSSQLGQLLMVPHTQGSQVQATPINPILQPIQITIQATPLILMPQNQPTVTRQVQAHTSNTGNLQSLHSTAASPPSNVKQGHLSQNTLAILIQERDRLKKENEALNELLEKYQRVFRNKDNLQYLANRLSQAQQHQQSFTVGSGA